VTLRAHFAIIGAGMAGASLAAAIAGRASAVLIEAEDQPGYHSTGRSAAFWAESYGGPAVQPLTSASGPVLRDGGFLSVRGGLHIAQAGGEAALAALEREFGGAVELKRLDRAELETRLPGLREGWNQGLLEPSCADIDVAALHAHYLAAARRSGVELITRARLLGAERAEPGWRLETASGPVEAQVLVNAAGAWADVVAKVAGVRPIGIQPNRRTIAQLRIDPPAPADLPLVIDAEGRFYFKPEAGGRLWLSPHDETPCAAGDCAAEEYDVALAVDRLQRAVDWNVERVERSWAGLRSFAPDRVPVYGFAPARCDFFWFAGQGGFGIQTAPAAAALGAALLLGTGPKGAAAGIDPRPYDPVRFDG
jgi:D-arginine dehydrogenase